MSDKFLIVKFNHQIDATNVKEGIKFQMEFVLLLIDTVRLIIANSKDALDAVKATILNQEYAKLTMLTVLLINIKDILKNVLNAFQDMFLLPINQDALSNPLDAFTMIKEYALNVDLHSHLMEILV